jgi:hypothetical protein
VELNSQDVAAEDTAISHPIYARDWRRDAGAVFLNSRVRTPQLPRRRFMPESELDLVALTLTALSTKEFRRRLTSAATPRASLATLKLSLLGRRAASNRFLDTSSAPD